MIKITSNADQVLSQLLADLSDKKALVKRSIEEELRETFPADDLSQIEVVVNDGDGIDIYNVSINGLSEEQTSIWDQRPK